LDVQNGRPEFNQARQINSKLMGYEWCYGDLKHPPHGPGTQFPHRRFTETRASLVDINGDSVPDHVVQERLDDQRIILAAYFNTGSGFELTPTRLSTAHSKSQRRPFDLVCSGR